MPRAPSSSKLARLSRASNENLEGLGAEDEVTQEAVAQLPDFSHLLPKDYRKDYMGWRSGRAQGAKGELETVAIRMQTMQDSLANNTSDEFTEVSVFRRGYASWRRGGSSGATVSKGIVTHWAV